MKPSAVCSPEAFEAQWVRPRDGPALIVGSKVYKTRVDRRTRYANAIGVDMEPGPGVDVVADLEEALPAGLGPFAHVDCLSVLEHSKRPWLLAANVERLMEPGATLFLSVPFVWRIHGYPSDFWRMTVDAVRLLFPAIEWRALRYVNELGGDDVPNIRHEGLLYFLKNEVHGFGSKR